MTSMGSGQNITVLRTTFAFSLRPFLNKSLLLCTIIVLWLIISSENALVSPKPVIQYHKDPYPLKKLTKIKSLRRNLVSKGTPKLSVAEALGCKVGFTSSTFSYLDNICHRCFNLFREIEIYYMCR